MKHTTWSAAPSGDILCMKTLPTLENDHFNIPGEIRYALLKKLLILPENARLEYDFRLCSALPETASFTIEFTLADGSCQILAELPTEETAHAAPFADWKRITIDLSTLADQPVQEICLVYHTCDLTTGAMACFDNLRITAAGEPDLEIYRDGLCSLDYRASIKGLYLGVLTAVPMEARSLNVLAYGAAADGKNDDTQAFQAALFAAMAQHGTVEVPAGTYRIAEHLVVPSGVTLKGVGEKSLLLAESSRDRFHGPSLLTLEGSASVSGLAVYYPEQGNTALVPYPYTITCQEGDHSLLEDLTLYNSYNGIRIGTAISHDVRVRNVRMTALRHGFTADCSDDLQVSGLTVSPAVWMESPCWPETSAEDTDAFCMALNLYLDAVAFGSCPGCTVEDVVVSWAKSALQCSDTTQVSMWTPRRPTFPHGPSGSISGLQIDHAALGLELNFLSGDLSVTHGSIDASGGCFPLSVRVSKAIRYGVSLKNLTLGSDGGCVEVITDRTTIAMDHCRFARWNPDYYCIDTEYDKIFLDHTEFIRKDGQLTIRNPDGIRPTDA